MSSSPARWGPSGFEPATITFHVEYENGAPVVGAPIAPVFWRDGFVDEELGRTDAIGDVVVEHAVPHFDEGSLGMDIFVLNPDGTPNVYFPDSNWAFMRLMPGEERHYTAVLPLPDRPLRPTVEAHAIAPWRAAVTAIAAGTARRRPASRRAVSTPGFAPVR